MQPSDTGAARRAWCATPARTNLPSLRAGHGGGDGPARVAAHKIVAIVMLTIGNYPCLMVNGNADLSFVFLFLLFHKYLIFYLNSCYICAYYSPSITTLNHTL